MGSHQRYQYSQHRRPCGWNNDNLVLVQFYTYLLDSIIHSLLTVVLELIPGHCKTSFWAFGSAAFDRRMEHRKQEPKIIVQHEHNHIRAFAPSRKTSFIRHRAMIFRLRNGLPTGVSDLQSVQEVIIGSLSGSVFRLYRGYLGHARHSQTHSRPFHVLLSLEKRLVRSPCVDVLRFPTSGSQR